MADLIFSEGFDLPDGRRMRLLAYDDWSIRLRLSHPNVDAPASYALKEAYLQGRRNDHVILKLIPDFTPPPRPTYIVLDVRVERVVDQTLALEDVPLETHSYLSTHLDRILGSRPRAEISVNVWRNDRDEIQVAYNEGAAPFRARINKKPNSVARHDELFDHFDRLLKRGGL